VNEEIQGILGVMFGGGTYPTNDAAAVALGGAGLVELGTPAAVAFGGAGELGGFGGTAGAVALDGEGAIALEPGATCGDAPTITLGTEYTFTINSGETHWFTFPATASTQYHVRCIVNSGSVSSCTVNTGTCGSPSNEFVLNPPTTTCDTFTPGSDTNGMIAVAGPLMGSGNYTITADTGACP